MQHIGYGFPLLRAVCGSLGKEERRAGSCCRKEGNGQNGEQWHGEAAAVLNLSIDLLPLYSYAFKYVSQGTSALPHNV